MKRSFKIQYHFLNFYSFSFQYSSTNISESAVADRRLREFSFPDKKINSSEFMKDLMSTPRNVIVNIIVIKLLIRRVMSDFIISKAVRWSQKRHGRVKCNISHGLKWVSTETLRLLHYLMRILHCSLLGKSRYSSNLSIAFTPKATYRYCIIDFENFHYCLRSFPAGSWMC